ncbi:polysaccharide deacetylase family protein [Jatrophihabitans sp. DSM 45814]
MPAIVNRRTMLIAAVAGVLTGCARAAHRVALQGSATPSVPSSTSATTAGETTTSNAPSGAKKPASSARARSTAPPGPANEISHGDRTRPEIALTFHGAGDPGLATEILQIAKAHEAQFTVMAVGNWLAQNPTVARAIVDGGHELGNHTWSHQNLTELGTDAARAEIIRCRETLRQVTGRIGAYFRPSATQFSTPLIRQLAGEAGYPVCLSYDVDSLDWTDPGAAAIRDNLNSATAGSIVSLHLGHQGTVEALPAILQDLARRKLTTVTASRLLRP